MHVISSYRGNRPTNTQTDRTDYKTDTAPQLVRSVIKNMSEREGVERWVGACDVHGKSWVHWVVLGYFNYATKQ